MSQQQQQSKRPAKLDLSAFDPAKEGTAARSAGDAKPQSITFVISGSAPVQTIDRITHEWWNNGVFSDQALKLRALVYELNQSDAGVDETPKLFQAGRVAGENMPITLIQPVSGKTLPPSLPSDKAPQAPAHESVNFSLPTLNKKEDIAANQQGWLDLLKTAGDKKYTLEVALRSPSTSGGKDAALEEVRDQVEELLGKSHASAQGNAEAAIAGGEDTGYRIVFESLASPPLHLASSQLIKSEELSDWASFISRLALHPRTYVKLSPLPLANLVPASLLAKGRNADYSSETLQRATDTATGVASGVESAISGALGGGESDEDRRSELRRRLRVFFDVLLEAFGIDRLVWAVTLGSGGAGGEEAVVKEWYEVVREVFAGMGLDNDALEGIFSRNASKVYKT